MARMSPGVLPPSPSRACGRARARARVEPAHGACGDHISEAAPADVRAEGSAASAALGAGSSPLLASCKAGALAPGQASRPS